MQHLAKLTPTQHWTANNPLRLVRSISADFIAQLETKIEQLPGFTHRELAKRLGVTLGRVSQMMNSPGNFTLKNAVVYASSVEMNVAVVTYPAKCAIAPISGDVFRTCWEIAGCPSNMFEINESAVGVVTQNGGMAAIGHTWGAAGINLGNGTVTAINSTAQTDWQSTAHTDWKNQVITNLRFEAKQICEGT